MESVKILFEGQEEILDVIYRNKDLVAYLGPSDQKRCPLLDAQIALDKKSDRAPKDLYF